jgi:type IV secretory pathway TrbD component
MALRRLPIHRSGIRPSLFLGGDRELVLVTGLLAFTLTVPAMNLFAALFGAALWCLALMGLRLMAKADPLMRFVYLRSRRYRGSDVVIAGVKYEGYYPSRSTPWTKK